MLVRLVLLTLLLGLCLYSIHYIRRQPAEDQKRLWWKAIFIGGGITLGLLAITGRMHWIGLIVAAIVPIFKSVLALAARAMPVILPWMQHKARQNQARAQSTTTPYLQFVVDDNGDMGGLITRGALVGKQLKDLTQDQLLSFYRECQTCRDSRDVFTVYLNKYHPGILRGNSKNVKVPNGLSQQEAQDILGLQAGFSKKDVIQAHRNLIQKLHPDRGGNDYLAAQINAAKERLLETLKAD